MSAERPPILLARLRRVLNYRVSIGALAEIALLSAIPYLIIGAMMASTYGEGLHQVQVEQGSDALVALLASIVSWPVLLFFHSCGT
ncbi:hypothetical protein [Mycobacterium sp.]|uniref:hypothetical protein n=1 Tax=Mycobacterium sp. TaxID=1785 RepID=UPI003D6AC28E